MRILLFPLILALSASALAGDTLEVRPETVTEWKSVYGEVEARDRVPARARIGGTVAELTVTEGDAVTAGQPIATIEDDKLNFQIDALEARLAALRSQLTTARADLARGEQLMERGVITAQRLEALQTAVDVIGGEIAGTEAEKLVVEQQVAEGGVLAPQDGIVLSVPVSRGSVIAPGESVAEIAGGGIFLRLAIPERHAGDLAEGDAIEIEGPEGPRAGRLVKLYPLIEGGRLEADVEVEGLDGRFVGRRLPVRLPVGERQAILVPEAALRRAGGLDMVVLERDGAALQQVVVPGGRVMREGVAWREILTGLRPGDVVVTGDE